MMSHLCVIVRVPFLFHCGYAHCIMVTFFLFNIASALNGGRFSYLAVGGTNESSLFFTMMFQLFSKGGIAPRLSD